MPSVFQDLCTVAKTKPKAGESFEAFAKRLTDKIGKVPDPVWESLSEAAQAWHNDTMTVFTDGRKNARAAAKEAGEDEDAAAAAVPIPELDGYEPVKDDLEGQQDLPLEATEETVDLETGEVTEAKSKKASKEKKVKAAKPAKEPKPAKAEKAAKVVKEKKAKSAKKADETRGRRSLFEDTDKVKVLVKPNPHRAGSTRWKAYAKLKDGATVAENVRLGVPRQQIWSMMNRELVKVG